MTNDEKWNRNYNALLAVLREDNPGVEFPEDIDIAKTEDTETPRYEVLKVSQTSVCATTGNPETLADCGEYASIEEAAKVASDLHFPGIMEYAVEVRDLETGEAIDYWAYVSP